MYHDEGALSNALTGGYQALILMSNTSYIEGRAVWEWLIC
jgi:hypothetical protein